MKEDTGYFQKTIVAWCGPGYSQGLEPWDSMYVFHVADRGPSIQVTLLFSRYTSKELSQKWNNLVLDRWSDKMTTYFTISLSLFNLHKPK